MTTNQALEGHDSAPDSSSSHVGSRASVVRGQLWLAFEEGWLLVILSRTSPAEHRAIRVVAPATCDIEGVAVEVPIGKSEGVQTESVVRVALPRSGAINCQWLVNVASSELRHHAGSLAPVTQRALDEALVRAGLESARTPGNRRRPLD